MHRRDVLRALGTLLVLPAAPLLQACDGGSDDTGDDTSDTEDTSEDTADTDTAVTCTIGDAAGDSNIHGHSISIPQADLEDLTGDRTYTSSGGGHSHTVTLTAADRQTLVDDCEVTVSSSTGGHSHTWLVTLP